MAVFSGQIPIKELERRPFEIESDQSDDWIQAVLERSAPASDLTGMEAQAWAQQAKLSAQLRVEKIGGDYLASGSLSGSVSGACSRCGDLFPAERASSFRVVLHRLEKGDESEDSGDADYGFFEGDQIDLVQLLAEQLIVLEPIAEAPEQDAQGDCRFCHRNPAREEADKSAGQDFEKSAFSPFAQLQGLKFKPAASKKA